MENRTNLYLAEPPPVQATQLDITSSYRMANFIEGINEMTSEVEYTDEFESQWLEFDRETQEKIAFVVRLLEEKGVNLESKYSSGINGSRYGHMRELKIQFRGQPFRILYAFDPRRVAILLLVGNKGGNERWYEENIPKADNLYQEHLSELKNEGLI